MYLWKKSAVALKNAAVRAGIVASIKPRGIESLEARRLFTGTWAQLSNLQPSTSGVAGASTAMVLTDGTLLVHPLSSAGSYSSVAFKLTPSASGSYVAGTWSTLTSSNVGRLYYASNVLQSGKVLEVGGEYSSAGNFTNTGEIYDPIANSWTNIPNFPDSSGDFGDDPSALLPNGTVLTGDIVSASTYIYNPTTNAWTKTGTKLRNDRSDEESWVTLPDHSILSYDVFSSVSTNVPHSQRYIPSTGTWVDAGNLPAQLSAASVGYELGPGLALPDGRVFFGGGTNATAYYNPTTNSWAAGPNFPNGYCMSDAPGAVLPNGNLLLAMSPQGGLVGGTYNFPSPTLVYELNPTTNIYTNVTPSLSSFSLSGSCFGDTFVVLPTGQVMMMNDSRQLAVYTEDAATSPVAAAVPVITGISYSGTPGVYTLSGTNLNGINEGASYGDDAEMSSNYPLVRLTDSAGNVTYARTTNWSLTGIFQGPETVTFNLPASATLGAYRLQVVANGVPSATALAVLVSANTTNTVTLQAAGTNVIIAGGANINATYPVSSFSSIYFVGDNGGDTLNVSLNDNDGSIITNLQAGSGTDTITINQTSTTGSVVILPSAGNDAVNVGTAFAGAALAQFQLAQQIGVLTVGSGGVATFTNTGTKKLLQADAILTSGTGVLDLTNNDMIVHAQSLSILNSEIGSGLNPGGTPWIGVGITSSTAAANTTHLTAVGAIQNSTFGSPIYAAFDGQATSVTDVLIKYTYFGDANLDGRVDGSDYSNIDNGFLLQSTGWLNGDFNYDGDVNGSDYTLIDAAYNIQAAKITAQLAPSASNVAGSVAGGKPNYAVFVPRYASEELTHDQRRSKHAAQWLASADPLPTGN